MSPNINHSIFALESVEAIVRDKRRNYVDKIQSILLAWGQLSVFVAESVNELLPEAEFETLFLRTLKVVLSADWKSANVAIHRHVEITLLRFTSAVSASGKQPSVLRKSRSLEAVVHQPWSHPTLEKILRDDEVYSISLLEYFQFENALVVAVRLAVLLEERQYDLAIRLSKSWLTTYNDSKSMKLDFNQQELDYITDVYFCTLYKKGMLEQLISEIRVYHLDQGLQLLKRHRSTGKVVNKCNATGIWKVFHRVTELIGDTLLADSIVIREDSADSATLLTELISEWVAIHSLEGASKFSPVTLVMMRKLVIAARSTKHIYLLCSFLKGHYHSEETDAEIMRWLIHAINRSINEIELSRVYRKLDELEAGLECLRGGYVLLSKLFCYSKYIYRECLLTAFSLMPSVEGLETIESVSDDSFHYQPAHSEFKAVPAYYSELENMSHLDETLKVDIHTILRHQRPDTLSWELEWSALRVNCVAHLQTHEVRGFGHEVMLNYLHLDYNLYKDLPIDEEDYIQIEKGYERFLATENLSEMQHDSSDCISVPSDESSFSLDDTDDENDEDFVVREYEKRNTKPQKRVLRRRATAGDDNDGKNVVRLTGDTKMTVRRGKRPAESPSKSDGESSAKKSSILSVVLEDSTRSTEIEMIKRSDTLLKGRSFKICLPRLPNNFMSGSSTSGRSPEGKRLTMRVHVARNKKPAMTEIDDSRLDNALQSIIETFVTPISSPVTPISSPVKRDSSPHATESQCDSGGIGPTVSPIIIRRREVIDRKKFKKRIVYTVTKRSAVSSSQPETGSVPERMGCADEFDTTDAWSPMSIDEWNPTYMSTPRRIGDED